MEPNETAADQLAAGREYIETNGLYRGDFYSEFNMSACSLGALMRANGTSSIDIDTGLAGAVAILAGIVPTCTNRDHHPESICKPVTPGEVVVHWNDLHASDQEVLDLFAHAEKIARLGFDPDAQS